ncbi:MAG: phosphomannomutase/phosphoglucomutase [Proteobacteria bacterium]|nr:phosphomannomutase/phosphoglucomutase [Pseudomonadota bacterium]
MTEGLPGGHVLLNDEIDGTFPAHHPDPTVESNLEQLKHAVADHRCDLGIAFDGDGDRIGVIDGLGRVLWGDQLLVILAREVLEDQPGATIIADVKSSRVFFDEIARMGGRPLMWKTGHSHIKNKMAEIGAPLGGEMSAHIFFRHRYYGFDDALYAAVRLLSAINRSGDSLAEIYDRLPVMVNTPELRFDCADDRKFAVIDEVRGRLGDEHGITVNDIDGVRVENEDGWWLLRASNTQPALVARCESTTPEGLERLMDRLRAQLEASGLALPETD